MRAEMWLCLPLLVARSAFCARCSVPHVSLLYYNPLRSGRRGAKRMSFSQSPRYREIRTVQMPPAPSQVARAAHQTTHGTYLPGRKRGTKQKLERTRAHPIHVHTPRSHTRTRDHTFGGWLICPQQAILRERTPRTRGRTGHRPPPSRYNRARCALLYREGFSRIGRSSREQRVL
jgi:hypothetical protein